MASPQLDHCFVAEPPGTKPILESGEQVARIVCEQVTASRPTAAAFLVGTGLLEAAEPGEPDGEVWGWETG